MVDPLTTLFFPALVSGSLLLLVRDELVRFVAAGPPRRPPRAGRTRFVRAVGVLIAVTALLPWPFVLRFLVSWPALASRAAELRADPGTRNGTQFLGLFCFERTRGYVEFEYFTVSCGEPVFGIVHCATDPASIGFPTRHDYTPIATGWYVDRW